MCPNARNRCKPVDTNSTGPTLESSINLVADDDKRLRNSSPTHTQRLRIHERNLGTDQTEIRAWRPSSVRLPVSNTIRSGLRPNGERSPAWPRAHLLAYVMWHYRLVMADIKPASWIISGARSRTPGQPLNVPPVFASNFYLPAERGYSRGEGTPTSDAPESLIGGLEGGRALAFSSGMAAIAAVLQRMAVGSVLAVPQDPYHGVKGLVNGGEAQSRWKVLRLDLADTGAWVDAATTADLLWLESPANPMITVADLPTIGAAPRRAAQARRAGGRGLHVRHAPRAIAVGIWRRHRDACCNEVHRGALGSAGGSAGRLRSCTA